MASPKIESRENRLTTKGLFPILNTLGKGRQDVWDSTYRAAQAKLAAEVPALKEVGQASELKLPEELTKFTTRLPGGAGLKAGVTPTIGAAQSAHDAYRNVWTSPESQAAAQASPWSTRLLKRLSTQGAERAAPTSLANSLDSATELASTASLAGMKLPGVAGLTTAIGVPLLANQANRTFQDIHGNQGVTADYADSVPIARVALAEQDYLTAHKAYSAIPETAPYAERKAAYDAMEQAQKAYAWQHKTYKDSILNGKVKGRTTGGLLPDATGQVGEEELSQRGLSEAGLEASPGSDALGNIGRNRVGGVVQSLPGMAKLSPLLWGAGGTVSGGLAPSGTKVQHGLDTLSETAPNMAVPAAALITKGLAKRTPVAMLAQSALNSLRQHKAFKDKSESEQDLDLNQRLLNESVAKANRVGKPGAELGNALTRGLGYLATGDAHDTATYLQGLQDPESLRAVAKEVAARRFEGSKINASLGVLGAEPALARYMSYEGAKSAAREHQQYGRQAARASQLFKAGKPEQLSAMVAENQATVEGIAKRLGAITPEQRANLDRLVTEYGSATIDRLWRNAPAGLIADDLKKPSPTPQ